MKYARVEGVPRRFLSQPAAVAIVIDATTTIIHILPEFPYFSGEFINGLYQREVCNRHIPIQGLSILS
jgi:hypothetical protein